MPVLLRTALLAGASLLAAAEVKVPPVWPQIQGIFPHGAQRGRELEITVRGRNLQQTRAILFKSPKLAAEVLAAEAYQVRARMRVEPGAELGRHDLRLVAHHGSALGYFDVSDFVESTEIEPNDDRRRARDLVFPALVNGVIRAGDYDYFRFQAKAGETLVFDVLGTRNGSPLDSVLGLLDEHGAEIGYSDDYYGFKDPHLAHRFEQAGTYYLRIYGVDEGGSENSDYRLIAGSMPHAYLAMPSGGTRGTTVELSLRGVNLAGVRQVTLGDGLAMGEVVSSAFGEAHVRLPVPAGIATGEYKLHARGATLPVPFVVSGVPEVTVTGGRARSRSDPYPVELPVVANGILDQPRAADHYVFRVQQAGTITLDVQSMQLGMLLDPLVVLYDEQGKRLAYQDDPTTNTGKEPANMDPHLVFRLPKAGRYVAAIRDAAYRGDAAYGYRMSIKRAEPDFSLRAIGTDEVLYRGRPNRVLVRVRRLEGWDTPVEVWAENLPKGVTAAPVVAEPKNTPYTGTCGETHYLDGTNVELVFLAASDAPDGVSQIRLRGRGLMNGKTVERVARTRYFKSRIRLIGDSEEEDLRVTVANAPGVVLATPQAVALRKDGTAEFTVIVTRLDEPGAPLEIGLEAAAEGLEMEPVTISHGVTRASIRIRAGTKAPGAFVLSGRAGGALLGKSHPVRVSGGMKGEAE